MAQFSYKARKRSGETVSGILDVNDRGAALAQIDRMGLFPVAVEAAKGGAAATPGKAEISISFTKFLPPALREVALRPRQPNMQELATFTQQLANLIKAGMPLTAALNSMTYLGSKGIPAEVAKQLRQDVTEGRSLSDAMAKQPVIFTDMYVNMVRAGEQSGSLQEVLRRLAEHYERFAEVRSKVQSALIYPMIVVLVGFAMVVVFIVFILPTFLSLFQGIKAELPASTRLLIGISNFIRNPAYLLTMALVAVAGSIVFLRFRASDVGRRMLDRWKLKAPLFGKVMRLYLFGQFARTLGTLMQNGVSVLTALKITEQVLPNTILKEAIAKTREAVTDGKTLAQPLARSQVFPQLMIDLIRIGEETGDVPGALRSVAESYESDLNTTLRVLMNLIEPVMIIGIAIVVVFLLLSVLQAMFMITSSIGESFGGR
ncbi:MAG: Type II secretion system protein [Limisphaerales bacterium]|nr:MAG: Type II secretion system protein [Limisphaerales bacterium]KAG0507473.1 MAG: Type II secretion system protein [Limisphaerales bacterium]TXT47956.1 MAG: Type II secretion system protein [Limisphaerales bacterium]